MPLPIVGQTGPQTLGDGNPAQLRLGRSAELVVTEYHGKYYEQNYRGNLYIATTPAAGAAIPLFSTAIQQFAFFNPPGSGVNMVLVRLILGYVSGAAVPAHLCLGHSLTVQAVPGTATAASVFNGRVGVPTVSGKVQAFSPCTPGTALTYHSALDLSFETPVAASTNAPFKAAHEFDGTVIAPPSALFSIAASVLQTGVYAMAMVYEEVPV